MKIILQEYKDILIKSSIEKDLIIKNLDENKNFDLYVLKDVEKSIFDNVVSFINNKRKKNFQLNINDIYFENKEKSKVNHWYENRKKRLEAQKKDDIKNIDELNQEKFQRIEQILEMSKLMKACNIGFTNIYKNISSDIKKQICIGYPIIRGKFRDGTFFSTPLILFKVDIQKNLNGFTINKLESSELTTNKSLLMGIEKFQNIKLENFDEFYEILNFETIENILKQLQAYDIFTEYYDFGFSEYEYTKEREKVFEINEYKVLNNMIIGEFENINSLYKDYSKLETIDLNNNLLGKILNKNNSNSVVVDDEIRTNDLFLYTALDYNEKLAIKTSELNNYIFRSENKNKKFDFLSNFIVNNIAKDKKVLVISENEKFLKNINERLAILENYICKVINEEKDKFNFYEKIKLKLDTMNLENLDYLTDLYEYGNFIDNKVSNLMRLDIILNSEYIKGLSIANLYEYFKKIDINDFKNVTCDLSSLEIFKFGDIVNTCRNIDNKLITAFNGYNENIKELKFLEEVKVLEIADVNKFDNILNNLCALFSEISSNKEGKDDLYYFLLKKLRTSKFLVSDENIMKLSALINTEKNKILKKKFLSEQWWRDGESDIEIADMLNKRLSNYKYMVTDELISDIASEVNLRRNGHLNKDITLDNVIYIAGADMEMCQRVSELLKENEYEEFESKNIKLAKKINLERNNALTPSGNNKGIKNLISGIINKKQIEANKKEFLTREKEILENITILSREISKQYKRNILKFQSNKEKYQKRYDEILEFTKEAAFRIKNRYIENRDKDYKNLAEYEVRYKEIEKYMLENKYLIVEFIDELENLKEFISDKLFILIAESFFLGNDIKPVLNELQKTVNIIGSQKEYTKLLSGMTEIEHNILNVSQILYNKEFGLDKLPDLYILNSKNKFEKTEEFKELKNLESSFKDEFDLIQKTLDAREKMVISHIKSFYNQKIVDLNGNKEYKKFKKQIQKKRNILGISDLFKLYNDRILDIYPCFLVNSTTASNIFPMNAEIFDYIIIDESSSLSLENYIPSLYRGRYLTLVGDKFNINSEIASDLLKDSLVSKSLIENTSNNQRLEYMHN